MLKLVRKAWRSPTWTTLFTQVASPLKFLLLTPLVLSRFSPIELDVFFLIASTTILFTILQNRLSNVFVRMLSFAFGGASDLGKWTGKRRPSSGNPNWELFEEAYLALGVILFLSCLPALLLSVGLMWLSVGALVDFSYQDKQLWLGAGLGAVSPAIAYLLLRPGMALNATGRIALTNQISGLTTVASIIVSALVVIFGGGLIGILCVQLAFITIGRWLMARRLPEEVQPYAYRSKWSQRVFAWAREPLWKGLVTLLAGMGVHRGVGVLLACTGTVGFAAPFLFFQSILNTCQIIASAPLNSQIPRYSEMLEKGERDQIGADSFLRIASTSILMGCLVLAASIAIPILLPFIGSNMTPLSTTDSLILGGLRVFYWPLVCFNIVQGVSNDVKVVWRYVVAVPFALLLFYIGSITQEYIWFSVGMYLPFIVAINWFTWKNYSEFVGNDGATIVKSASSMGRQRLVNIFPKHTR